MYYVLTDNGCEGEYNSFADAAEHAEMLEDAWVSSDEEEPEDSFDECGFDPYMGDYSYDC